MPAELKKGEGVVGGSTDPLANVQTSTLLDKDYGDIVGAINALIPTGLGTDVNANLDALDALMASNTDATSDFNTAVDTLNYLAASGTGGVSAESIAASIRDAAFKQLDEIFKSDMTDEQKRIAGS